MPLSELEGKTIVVVDDVGNTGRTLFYACKPLLEVLPHKVEMAVLVDRKHKSFPVKVDYVGLSLATTLREHIDVQLSDSNDFAAYLHERP
jgi:pyrimidine operon attenuation protein/uracil phosphoribosyltransferase